MKRKPKIKHYVEYGLLRFVQQIMRALPLSVASGLMGFLWQKLAPYTKRQKRALLNISRAFPDKDSAWHKTTIRAHWQNLGRTFGEGLCLSKISEKHISIAPTSLALLKAATKKNTGIVFVSLHSGNWEALCVPTRAIGQELAGLYQKAENPLSDALIQKMRKPIYGGGLHSKSRATVNHFIKWLRDGNGVCIMADLRQHSGVATEFFGQSVPSTPFPALLSEKLETPLIAAVCRRRHGVSFEIDLVEIPSSAKVDQQARIEERTQFIQTQFENWIRQAPSQWMWGHRRS